MVRLIFKRLAVGANLRELFLEDPDRLVNPVTLEKYSTEEGVVVFHNDGLTCRAPMPLKETLEFWVQANGRDYKCQACQQPTQHVISPKDLVEQLQTHDPELLAELTLNEEWQSLTTKSPSESVIRYLRTAFDAERSTRPLLTNMELFQRRVYTHYEVSRISGNVRAQLYYLVQQHGFSLRAKAVFGVVEMLENQEEDSEAMIAALMRVMAYSEDSDIPELRLFHSVLQYRLVVKPVSMKLIKRCISDGQFESGSQEEKVATVLDDFVLGVLANSIPPWQGSDRPGGFQEILLSSRDFMRSYAEREGRRSFRARWQARQRSLTEKLRHMPDPGNKKAMNAWIKGAKLELPKAVVNGIAYKRSVMSPDALDAWAKDRLADFTIAELCKDLGIQYQLRWHAKDDRVRHSFRETLGRLF